MGREADAFAVAAAIFFFLAAVSSTKRASKLSDSGKIHVRMVEPRTLSVAHETGFLPRLCIVGVLRLVEARKGKTVW
jgi:hypothetical protein